MKQGLVSGPSSLLNWLWVSPLVYTMQTIDLYDTARDRITSAYRIQALLCMSRILRHL